MDEYKSQLIEAVKYANHLPYCYSADIACTSHGFWLEVSDRRRINHVANCIVPFDEVGKLADNMDQLVQRLK